MSVQHYVIIHEDYVSTGREKKSRQAKNRKLNAVRDGDTDEDFTETLLLFMSVDGTNHTSNDRIRISVYTMIQRKILVKEEMKKCWNENFCQNMMHS